MNFRAADQCVICSMCDMFNLQIVEVPGTAALSSLVDADDVNYGKCSVIFVGIVPTAGQKTQLQDYSRKFKVPCLLSSD